MGFLGNLLGKAADVTYNTGMTVAQALQQWAQDHPKEMEFYERNNLEPDVTVLTDPKYADVRFDAGMKAGLSAARVLDGKFYYTVGEYNAALAKDYNMY